MRQDVFKPLFGYLLVLATPDQQEPVARFWLDLCLDQLQSHALRSRLFGVKQLAWIADHHAKSVRGRVALSLSSHACTNWDSHKLQRKACQW